MDAITFFAVAAIAVVCVLLVAVGGLAAFLWVGVGVVSRSWQVASAWRKLRAAVAAEARDPGASRMPDQPPVAGLRAMTIRYQTTRESNELHPHLGTGTP